MKKEFERIVVPVDGSDIAKKAAKKAIFLAKSTGIKAVAMYVVNIPNLPALYECPDEIPYIQVHQLLKDKGNSYLEEIEKLGKKMGVNVSKKIVDGHPAEEIIKEVKKNNLVVIGSKGTTALDRLLMGSVAENVVHHAPCPVMVVK
jgi:nucleotide-binding universal stress UspA family protein